MMTKGKLGVPLLVAAALVAAAEAQDGWTWLSPLPPGFALTSVVFQDSARGFISGFGGAILGTTDGGETWSRLPTPSYKNLEALAFPGPQVGLAVGFDGALLRSENGGSSWTAVPTGTPKALYQVDGLGNVAFASGDGVFLRSVDAGLHWEAAAKKEKVDFGEIQVRSATTLYAAGSAHGPDSDTALFLKSVDGGSTWSHQQLKPETEGFLSFRIKRIFFPAGDTGFVHGQEMLLVDGEIQLKEILLKTEDGGAHWQRKTVPDDSRETLLHFKDARRGVAISFGLQGYNTYNTEDGGATWSPAGDLPDVPGKVPMLASVYGFGSNSLVVIGSGIIYKSSDGGKTWRVPLSGADAEYGGICFTDAQTGYALTGMHSRPDLLATNNGGKDWVHVSTILDTVSYLDVIWSALRFSSAQNGVAVGGEIPPRDPGVIFHTADAGAHWSLVQQTPAKAINDMRFSAGTTGVAVGDSGTILKTLDGGAHWTSKPAGVDHNLYSVEFPDAAVGFALGVKWSKPELMQHETVLLRSEDGGETWKRRASLTGFGGVSIRFVDTQTGFMTGSNDTTALASVIMKTRDGGLTWKKVAEVDHFTDRSQLHIEFQDSLNIFVLGFGKVYRSYDAGESWSSEDIPYYGSLLNLQFPTPDAGFLVGQGAILKVVPGAPAVIRAAHGRGTAPALLGSDLRYRLEAAAHVTALLFDFRGRQVFPLLDALQGPGIHQLPWPARIPHGSYLIDFRVGRDRRLLPVTR